MKRISVCVPSSNQARTITDCIQSALDQSFGDWELLICDDGSTDGSADIVRSFAENEPLVRASFHDEPLGYAATVNELLEQSEADYITILSHHDRYLDPEVLVRAVAALDADPELGLSYGAYADLDEEGHALAVNREFDRELRMSGTELQHTILRFRMPRLSTVVIRRSLLESVAPLNEKHKAAAAVRWLFEVASRAEVLFAAKLGVGHPMEGLPGTTKLEEEELAAFRKTTLKATRALAAESRQLSLAWESSRKLLSTPPAIPSDAQQILEQTNTFTRAPLPAPAPPRPAAPANDLYGDQPASAETSKNLSPTQRSPSGETQSGAKHGTEPDAALPSPSPESTRRRLLIFGPCVDAMDIVDSGELDGDVLAFADAAPEAQGKSLLGIPVLHPRDALALSIDAVILISEMHHEKIEAWFTKNRPRVEIVRCWDDAKTG